MRRKRVTRAEAESAVRQHGYAAPSDVSAVVLETDGSISVVGREQRTGRGSLNVVPKL